LYKQDHQVTVIDQDASAFDHLSEEFHGRTIVGDVLAQNVLHRAEIERADALAAVTTSDSLNALVAHVARTEYKVPKVVARNYNPRQRPLQEAFNIPVIGSAGWGIQRIEELLSESPLQTVLMDDNASFSVIRLEIPEPWHGYPLQELVPDYRWKILSWTRASQSLPVSLSQPLQTGDLVYLSIDPVEIEGLRNRLALDVGSTKSEKKA
jgi:trk system potassium uptake protein TrkA